MEMNNTTPEENGQGYYEHLDQYLSSGFKEIHGWCPAETSNFCKMIDTYQYENNIEGSIAEIGVHHGLFFIMLNSMSRSGFKSWAIDVFENQELNIDNSGKGSEEKFLENLRKYDRYRGGNVNILRCDSTTTDLSKLIDTPIRILSIDGGHTCEHTIADLKSSQKIIHPEGVVIVDDIVNHQWLGVIEGCIIFLQSRPTLVPFAISRKKLFMCNLTYLNNYSSLFRKSKFCVKSRVRFMGWDLVAI